MRPEDLEKIPKKIESIFYDLQNRVMSDVVERIKLTEELSATSEYLIRKLQMFGGTSEYLESEIKRLTDMTDQELIKIFDEVIAQDYMGFESIYKKTGVPFIPYEVNRVAQSWTKAILKQTKDEIENITQSLGFMVDYGTKKVFTPLAEYYHEYMDKACMDVVTGTYSYETVLKKVVKEMTTSGMRTVDYASGYSSRATVAARRAVLTGAHQMSAKINEQTAKDLNTDTYEVTWHSGHRPDHWWGGNVYSHRELVDTCGLGTVTGLCGANCRHSYYAFIPGISVRTYTDSQLAEMERREAVQQSWQGKSYTTYEVTQKQRQMETQMRKQRSDIELLKSGSGSKDDILAAQGRYINTLRKYQGFSGKMKIPAQMERVYIDGLGRIANNSFSTKTIDTNLENVIIKQRSLNRKKKENTIQPMPKKQLQKIVKGFKKSGGIIQMNDETDAYLKSKHAEGVTLNGSTILLSTRPGRAAVFEELIHARQWRQGKVDGSLESILSCEIEAQRKLIKYQSAYQLTEQEVRQTKKALETYEKDLERLLNGGE